MKTETIIIIVIIAIFLGWWIYVIHDNTYHELHETIKRMDSIEIEQSIIKNRIKRDTIVINFNHIDKQDTIIVNIKKN